MVVAIHFISDSQMEQYMVTEARREAKDGLEKTIAYFKEVLR